MATLRVDTLDFHFRPEIDARRYDESRHYRAAVQQHGKRAVDVTAVEVGQHPRRSWLIEVKDYRVLRGEPKDAGAGEIAADVCQKVNDTLFGLRDASHRATDGDERDHARRVLSAGARQVVFHLEPYRGPASKLFPRDPTAHVLQKLRQVFRTMDPRPLVLNIETTHGAGVPWTVS